MPNWHKHLQSTKFSRQNQVFSQIFQIKDKDVEGELGFFWGGNSAGGVEHFVLGCTNT